MAPSTQRLPNFVFVGPDKSGSSWLHKVLARHPEVYVSPAKDTYFFDREYARGIDWYAKNFSGAASEAIVAEICHDYLFGKDVPSRIDQVLNGDCRLMVCLREPAERAVSAYLNLKKNGWDIGSFFDAVEEHPEIISNGLYFKHLSWYRSFVDQGRLYVGDFAVLQSQPQVFLDGVTDWLGLERIALDEGGLAVERAASQPRSAAAARIVKSGAKVARRLGWASVVGRVKTSPAVQRSLYKEYERKPSVLDEREMAELRARYARDVYDLDILLGTGFASAWGY